MRLSPDEGWVDGNTGALADRQLLMTALSDVEAVLIRATVSLDDGEQISYLSNAVLDTAIVSVRPTRPPSSPQPAGSAAAYVSIEYVFGLELAMIQTS